MKVKDNSCCFNVLFGTIIDHKGPTTQQNYLMATKSTPDRKAESQLYDYTMSLYVGMVTIRVMDAINEEFPEAYPEKRLCLGGWNEEAECVSYMNLNRNGNVENEKISSRKPYMA